MTGLSLIVATHGRSAELRALLDSLLAHGGPALDVIIADQNDDDRVAELLRVHPLQTRHLRLAQSNASAARNAGAALARHDWLGFPDDDCRFLPDTMAALRQAIAESNADIISGITVDEAEQPNILRWRGQAGPYDRWNQWRCATEATLFLRRDLFLAVGGFDADFGPGAPYPAAEAAEMLTRLFSRIPAPLAWFSPQIRLYHPTKIPPWTMAAAERVYAYAKGEGALLAKHPSPSVRLRSLRFLVKHSLAGLLPGMLAYCSRRKLSGFVAGYRQYARQCRLAASDAPPALQRRQALADLAALLGGQIGPGQIGPGQISRLRQDGAALHQVVDLAVQHQLRGPLWRALVRHGLMAPLPQALRASLPAGHPARILERGWRHEERAGTRLRQQCSQAITVLNAAGIEPMLLKGMALVMAENLPEPARRWMCDIDMLIPSAQMAAARSALLACGYHETDNPAAPHHAAPLALPANDAGGAGGELELHHDMVLPALQPALPTALAWQTARRIDSDGLHFLVPDAGTAILHTALHAQAGEHSFARARIPLRRLLDFIYLARRYGDVVDWPALAARVQLARQQVPFEVNLLQAQRLFGLAWPLPDPPSLRARLHWRLCLAAIADPERLGRLLHGLLECRQAFSAAGAGQGLLSRRVAQGRLALHLALKYRGRIWARLLGRR